MCLAKFIMILMKHSKLKEGEDIRPFFAADKNNLREACDRKAASCRSLFKKQVCSVMKSKFANWAMGKLTNPLLIFLRVRP